MLFFEINKSLRDNRDSTQKILNPILDVFHSYKLGNTNVSFYIDEGDNLRAIYESSGIQKQAIKIEGIPLKFTTQLDTPQKKERLKYFLENSFCNVTSGQVSVNCRIKGGWGVKQHRGYRYSYSMASVLDGITRKLPMLDKIMPLEISDAVNNVTHKVTWYFPDEGTYHWAYEVGFIYKHQATTIGNACNDVDAGDTDPVLHLDNEEAQSWHFNTNFPIETITRNNKELGCRYAGYPGDSRMQHAVVELKKAIDEYNNGVITPEVLHHLGKGLHPLQDIFAHGDQFVTAYQYKENNNKEKYIYSHANEKGKFADVAFAFNNRQDLSKIPEDRNNGLNQRYSDTKTITYIYFLIFLYNTGLFEKKPFSDQLGKIKNIVEKRSENSDIKNFSGLFKAAENIGLKTDETKKVFKSIKTDKISQSQNTEITIVEKKTKQDAIKKIKEDAVLQYTLSSNISSNKIFINNKKTDMNKNSIKEINNTIRDYVCRYKLINENQGEKVDDATINKISEEARKIEKNLTEYIEKGVILSLKNINQSASTTSTTNQTSNDNPITLEKILEDLKNINKSIENKTSKIDEEIKKVNSNMNLSNQNITSNQNPSGSQEEEEEEEEIEIQGFSYTNN